MNENKVAFIICTNNDQFLNECLVWLEFLNVPDGIEIEVLTITDAPSMLLGMQEGRESTDAKYKVYLHQDVFILNRNFIRDILDIFGADDKIGMIGMAGVQSMPPDGMMWSEKLVGAIYTKGIRTMDYADYQYEMRDENDDLALYDVVSVDGFLFATAYDVPLRSELFEGWDFYDVSTSLEYKRKGYRVVVPKQKMPWCLHDDGTILSLWNYDKYRRIAIEEYSDFIGSESFPRQKKKLVSVIIPTYNRMGTLERSIESVLKQTYDNFELLIIDDGSSDGTEEYVRSLQDQRVRYYRNEFNMGPSASRNKGVTLAKGEYLAFHDSDDEWEMKKLEKTMSVLMQSGENTGMVYHEMREQGERGNLIPSRAIPVSRKEGKIFDYMLLYPLIGIPAAVIKKSCFENIGGFSEEINSLEDYEFFLRMAKQYEIAFIEEPLIIIYDTPGSVNKQYKNKIDAELYILKKHYDTLHSHELLQKKIQLIRLQADNYGIEDYFYDKVFALCKNELDKEQAEFVLRSVHQAAMTFVPEEKSDRSTYFQNATEQMERLVASLSGLQANICANAQVLVQNKKAICEAMFDVLNDLGSYTDLCTYPQRECDELHEIENALREGMYSIPVMSRTVDKILKKSRELLQQIGMAKCVCTACGSQVRFLPLSSYQRKVREYWGNVDVNKVYLFEDEEKDRCPVCGATQQIRFLLGFLEDVQGEDGEMLKVACIHTGDEMYQEVDEFVQKYTLLRDDMEYMKDACFEAKKDVLVAVNVLDGTNDMECLRKIRTGLTDRGICILLVPAIRTSSGIQSQKEIVLGPGEKYIQHCYTQDELLVLVQQAGFEMQVADQTWFGTEYYAQYGFGNHAKLYMLTVLNN
ncbi:MAG: glycosyltransferase [Lachnospiraceae bacterium]|nr:glycosyltransferase [Lachnospiraceae bacterium]